MKKPRPAFLAIDGEVTTVVSAARAEAADVCVCMPWSLPPILSDNLRATCADCGVALQHRPSAPKKPRKVCIDCAIEWVRAHD
jgi:hypothetical protein